MRIRTKTVEKEAMLFDGSNHNDIKRFTQGGCYTDVTDAANPRFMIRTLEGEHIASTGDYIIKGLRGEFYPCKPDIFEKTYDVLEECEGCGAAEVQIHADAGDNLLCADCSNLS